MSATLRMETEKLKALVTPTQNRFEMWPQIVEAISATSVAEIGVFRGNFARAILERCTDIATYYFVDPWRHLDDGYNELANVSDDIFTQYKEEALSVTAFAGDTRVVLQGMTQEVIDQVPDESLDFVYIDADHTLRGITVDLIKWFPKVKPGGYIGGDDFGPTIFQQPLAYEPSPIFPWAVHFAEAMDISLYALPHWQFLLHKNTTGSFSFTDLTDGDYADVSLRSQVVRGPSWYFKKQYLVPLYHRLFPSKRPKV